MAPRRGSRRGVWPVGADYRLWDLGGGFAPGKYDGTVNGKPTAKGGEGRGATYFFRDIDSDREVAADGILSVANETLYKRGKTWVANNAKDLDPEKDTAKIQEIKRFSDEYFALVRANTQDENAVLAAQQEGEELLVRFRGQAFLVK